MNINFIQWLLFSLLILPTYINSLGQTEKVKVDSFCMFSPGASVNPCNNSLELNYEELKSTDTLMKIIEYVLTENALKQQNMKIGLIRNQFINALYCRPIEDKISRILINRKITTDYWVSVGVLFHELGHLLSHHENICSNATLELDADYFAGRCLALIKASEKEAVECLRIIDTSVVSDLYPTVEERKLYILRGYKSFYSGTNISSYQSKVEKIRWKKNEKNVSFFIEGKEIIVLKYSAWAKFKGGSIDPKLGILYIDSTNSTYQLFRFKEDSKGLGQLVNDKTSLTYMRFGTRYFRFYEKGRIVKRTNVQDIIKEGNDIDYEIYYRDSAGSNLRKRIVFVNYFFCPPGLLMPAFYK